MATAQRALYFSHIIADEAWVRGIESVGGLMQVHFVERGGTRAIPYERWVDIDESVGAYVMMDIDYVMMDIDAEGAWRQIHEPSGLTVPLRFPEEPDFNAVSSNFELQRQLTKDSPGVQLKPNPVEVYKLLPDASVGCVVRIPGDS